MAMNIVQLQDNLKNLSDQQLAQSMQMPSQDTPPFLVVSELNRRKKMREDFQAQQASQNQTTVAQDVVAAAGVPQQAASQMAQSLAPQTDMTNNTGIMSIPQGGAGPAQGMAGGGVVKMATGKAVLHDKYGNIVPDPALDADESWWTKDLLGDPDSWWTRSIFESAPEAQRSGPTPLSIFNEQEAARNAPPAEPPPETQTAPATGGGSAKRSDYEQMLMDAKANADKKAKQDKWMALAQMGLSMMSSQSPTLLGAIGEASAASLPMYQQARDTADTSKLEAAKGLYALEAQRAAAAAAGAKTGQPKPIDDTLIKLYVDKAKAVQEALANAATPAQQSALQEELDSTNLAINQLTQVYGAQRGLDLSKLGIGSVDSGVDFKAQ